MTINAKKKFSNQKGLLSTGCCRNNWWRKQTRLLNDFMKQRGRWKDLLLGFSSPKQQQHCLRKSLEVVVPVDLRVVPQRYLTKHLNKAEEVVTADRMWHWKTVVRRDSKKEKKRKHKTQPSWGTQRLIIRGRNNSGETKRQTGRWREKRDR